MRACLIVILLSVVASSCNKFEVRSRDKQEKSAEDSQVAADADGVVKSRYDAQATSNFEVTAKDAGAITGAGISIPAGTVSLDTNITLQEGGTIVSDASAQNLGIDGQGVAAAGPAVLVAPEDSKAKLTGNVSITLPLSGAQDASLALTACVNYTVFFKIKDSTGAVVSGALASKDLSVAETSVTFAASGFGVFQAACIGRAIEVAVTKATQEPILSKREEAALTPITWTLGEPVFVAATRSFDISFAATGLADGSTCFAAIDQDKASPSDKIIPAPLGSKLNVAALNDAAHTVYLRVSCFESANGRSSKSPWSSAMAFTAKSGNGTGSGTGTGTGTGSGSGSTITPPVVYSATITTPSANATVGDTFSMAGDCSPSGNNVLIDTPVPQTAACVAGHWSRPASITSLTDGTQTFTAIPQGKTLAHGASVTVTKDTTGPVAPTALTKTGPISPDLVILDTNPTFTWTGSGDSVKYDLEVGSAAGQNDIQSSVNLTSPSKSLINAATNGMELFVRVRAYDAVGNVGAWSTNLHLYVDLTAPAFTSTAVASTSTPGAIDSGMTMASDLAGHATAKIVRSWTGTPPADCSGTGATVVMNLANPSAGTYSESDKIGGFSRMKYGYRFCLTDKLGRTTEQTVANVLPKANPGPGCMKPPCDLAKGTAASDLTSPLPGDYRNEGGSQNFFSAVLGDIDNDMDLDVIVGFQNSHAPLLYLNDLHPGNSFLLATSGTALGAAISSSQRLILADFSGDGFLDLAVGTGVMKNNGNGTFAANSSDASACGFAMAAGDVTGDGILDLVCGPRSIYPGNGDGTFSAAILIGGATTADTSAARDVALGDFNGDGRLDIVVAKDGGGGAGDHSRVYLNNGGNLAGLPGVNLTTGTYNTKSVKVGYVGADSFQDVVMFNGDQILYVKGHGNGSFHSETGPTVSSGVEFGVLADLVGDGSVNAVAFGPGILSSLFDGTDFGAEVAVSPDAYDGRGGDVGDLNGDGMLDFVTSYYGAQKMKFYLSPAP